MASARRRVLNERLDLLSYLTAKLKINQRMSVHFDDGIGLSKTCVEGGKMKVCASQVRLVARQRKTSGNKSYLTKE